MATVTNLTIGRARELLDYNPETGEFRWRGRASQVPSGSVAGCVDRSTGYRKISIANERYYEHRLAWLYVHGEWPPEQVDHINRDRTDNRIANLRLATNGQNCQNSRPRRDGLKGVHFNKNAQKWCAQIHLRPKRLYLGLFDTEEEAHEAYCKAARELFGAFHRAG